MTKLGVVFVEIHAGLDEQAQPGYSIDKLLDDGKIAGVPFSVAGGVKVDTIAAVRGAGADVAVAGGAIYSAEDPRSRRESLEGRADKQFERCTGIERIVRSFQRRRLDETAADGQR